MKDTKAIKNRLSNTKVRKFTSGEVLETTNDLIQYLFSLGVERQLMICDDGNTYPLTTNDIRLWDKASDDPTYPIAFYYKDDHN